MFNLILPEKIFNPFNVSQVHISYLSSPFATNCADNQNKRLAMTKIVFLLVFIFSISFSRAQLLSWAPSFPQENDAPTNVVITADATKGNQGLLNYTPTNDVYVHIGVMTNLSSNYSRAINIALK
jgi:hypothetical protein